MKPNRPLSSGKPKRKRLTPGDIYHDVLVETVLDPMISRPRVRPVSVLSPDLRVEFPRKLREKYPLGTKFLVTALVCQKHFQGTSVEKGPPYLRASDIMVQKSTKTPGKLSGRAYTTEWAPA